MTTAVLTPDLLPMSQRERDILKIMHPVLQGQRTGAEAARLLGRSTRQVRRLLRKLQDQGDAAIVHGLRGRPSNRRTDSGMRRAVVAAYKARYADFGPTLAAEKLAAEGLHVCRETLRRWLIAEGLWQRRRQREPHRSRRPRRDCFGELVQMDASFHDWLEGRGETLVLIALIDDATGRVLARFYEAGTVVTHMDLLRRWLRKYGRPLAVYTDRHSIFEPQDKGRAVALAETQFGRALRELDIELIRAHSPQAKGRVERLFGTAQDRWVKELRLAKATTLAQANAVLDKLLPHHNRAFAKKARAGRDAHRDLGATHKLDAILSIQEVRTVSNDYVVRLANRQYQLLPPALPGLRGGKVVIEQRLDGTMAMRLGSCYLRYHEITGGRPVGGSAPEPPKFNARAADAREEDPTPGAGVGSPGIQPTVGRSGCASAEPYPPDGAAKDSARPKGRPAQDHPWRTGRPRKK